MSMEKKKVGVKDKSQLSAPTVSDPDVQRAIEKIYEDLNILKDSTNIEVGTDSRESEGKPGNIRLVQESGKYAVTEEGLDARLEEYVKWSAKTEFLAPDYDSGWISVDNHRTQGTHNLGVIPKLTQVQWSNDNGVNVHVNWDTTSSYGYDIWLSETTWQVTSSTYYGWYNENTLGGGTGWASIDQQGKFRVLCWK
jgi:hypothetical protein